MPFCHSVVPCQHSNTDVRVGHGVEDGVEHGVEDVEDVKGLWINWNVASRH